ncbi:MAG: acyltransferase domain-containing protein [Chloroflexi bacterium]|nr:acyltransferase domain-containing protein [Chloroflexota bacterium]
MSYDETDGNFDIAVVGLAGRWAGAPDTDRFWQQLCAGAEGISFFDDEQLLAAGVTPEQLAHPRYVKAGSVLEGVELFDAAFFGYSPREAELLDPQQRIFLECAWQALEHAGYNASTYPGLIGVFAGSSLNTYLLRNLASQQGRGTIPDLFQLIMGNDKDFLPTRVSYKLNLRGPSFSVQSACSTSLVATHLACQSLLGYQCDIALAGGISITVPQHQGYLAQEGGILTPDGHCRTFDAQAQGTLNGNGAGIVVLKRLDDALADGDSIYAVIKGSAVNNDGALKIGYTAPSIDGQAAVIQAAQAVADVDPATISYIEAHGTATALGDPIEVAALTKAFRQQTDKTQFCMLGSVKSNFGHLDTAAGVTSLIKTVLALHHNKIPASLHFQTPNPQLELETSPFYVNTQLSDWPSDQPIRRAGVSSFGIGGTNAHVVLEEAPMLEPTEETDAWQMLVISGRNRATLNAATKNLAEHLEANPQLALADVAYTLQIGRQAFNHRRVLLCRSLDEASQILRQRDKRMISSQVSAATPAVVFMFPGGGVQYPSMGQELYQTQPIFRAAVERCLAMLKPETSANLRQLVYSENAKVDEQQLATMLYSLLAIFISEYALAQLWLAWGIQPVALIGHSLGEYTAAHLAGSISLEAALQLVELRGRLMDQLEDGAMINIALAEAEVLPLLSEQLSLAAVNGPEHSVVAGSIAAIQALELELEQRAIKYRRLPIRVAAHSSLLKPMVAEFAAFAQTISMQPAIIPYISNVTGAWMSHEQWSNPNYWTEHLQSTVRFSAGMSQLLQNPAHLFLEVGPGQTLTTLTRAQANFGAERVVAQSMRHPQDQQTDTQCLLTAVGRLWLAGVAIDWTKLSEIKRRRVALPTYPFERKRYWVEQFTSTETQGPTLLEAAQGGYSLPESSEQTEASPGYERPNLTTEYVAPSNNLEHMITALWGAVLGVPLIGIHDNFFELGGDSLLALQVATHLTEKVHTTIGVRSLFEAPTIAELAQLVQAQTAEQAGELSSLVRLQPQGQAAPFFCIHPMSGMANVYAALAQLLGTQRPFYGVQAFGLEYPEMPLDNIKVMAQRYLSDIRQVQPQGPYLLGGWSMGGSIAFEIASQLVTQGETVSLLALIDTPAKLTGTSPATLTDLELLIAMLGVDANILGIDDPKAEASEAVWNELLSIIKQHLGLPESYTLQRLRHLVSTFRTHSQAVWNYQPANYPNDVLVLRAADLAGEHDDQLNEAYRMADLGWSQFVSGQIQVQTIPGTHNTLLNEPSLPILASHLAVALHNVAANPSLTPSHHEGSNEIAIMD